MSLKLLLETHQVKGVATFGQLFVNGRHFAFSLEREWKNNQPNISCIPAGTYDLVWHQSPKFGEVVALSSPSLGVHVTGGALRNYVYFHSGNTVEDTTGCILLGSAWNPRQWALVDSDKATEEFYKLIDNHPSATLEIKRY